MNPTRIIVFCLVATMLSIYSCQPTNPCIVPLNPVYETISDFKLLDEFNVDIPDIGETKISLYEVSDWTDPGDFLKIIISNKKYTLTLTNIDGWVKFDQNYGVSQALKRQNGLPTDLTLLLEHEGLNLLVLFGWVYASQPGLCTIIDLNKGELVFNKNVELNDFSNGILRFTETKTQDGCVGYLHQ